VAKVSLTNGTLKNWVNGDLMTAEQFKKEREIVVTAINDNYERIKELENNIEISAPQEYSWEATSNQQEFVLVGNTFPTIPNIVEVSMEGFDLTEGEEFEILNSTTIKLSSPVTTGTRVYAKWYEVRTLKLFTTDLQAFTIMGVF
jgi:hypothetical protein